MVKFTTFCKKQLSKNIYLQYSLYDTVRLVRHCGGLFVVYSAISFSQTSDLLSVSESTCFNPNTVLFILERCNV